MATDDHPDLASAARAILTSCRECRDERDFYDDPVPPAEFIIWGKLAEPEALGPKCYDHAVKHLGSAMPGRADQYAVVDLRPLRAALSAHDQQEGSTASAGGRQLPKGTYAPDAWPWGAPPPVGHIGEWATPHGSRYKGARMSPSDVPICRNATRLDGPGDLPADTPEPPPCKTCANSGWIGSRSDPTDCPTCGRKPYWLVGDGTYPSPATDRVPQPSDGPDYHADHAAWQARQPTDDELLADADEYVRRHAGAASPRDEDAHLVLDLAAELRGRRGDIERLERELAESREELATGAADSGSMYQAGHQRGLTEARDDCPHVVSSGDGTSYCDLAERSHGEVLARITTQHGSLSVATSVATDEFGDPPELDCPPGTDVLVVRADQEATNGE